MLLLTPSLETDGQLSGMGRCKALIPAVISVWESDGWVILFLGCQAAGCSHANLDRGVAPL